MEKSNIISSGADCTIAPRKFPPGNHGRRQGKLSSCNVHRCGNDATENEVPNKTIRPYFHSYEEGFPDRKYISSCSLCHESDESSIFYIENNLTNLIVKRMPSTMCDERVTPSLNTLVTPQHFSMNKYHTTSCIEIKFTPKKKCTAIATQRHSYSSVCSISGEECKESVNKETRSLGIPVKVVKDLNYRRNSMSSMFRRRAFPVESCSTSHAHRTETNVAPFTMTASFLLRLFLYTLLLINLTNVQSKSIFNSYLYRHNLTKDQNLVVPEMYSSGLGDSIGVYPSRGKVRSQVKLSLGAYDVIPNDSNRRKTVSADKTDIVRTRKFCTNNKCKLHNSSREIKTKPANANISSSSQKNTNLPSTNDVPDLKKLPSLQRLLSNIFHYGKHILFEKNESSQLSKIKTSDNGLESKRRNFISNEIGRGQSILTDNRVYEMNAFKKNYIPQLHDKYDDFHVSYKQKDDTNNNYLSRKRRSMIEDIFHNATKEDFIGLAGVVTNLLDLVNSAWSEDDSLLQANNHLWLNHLDYPTVGEARNTETGGPAAWVDRITQKDYTYLERASPKYESGTIHGMEHFDISNIGNNESSNDAKFKQSFGLSGSEHSSSIDVYNNHLRDVPHSRHKKGPLRSLSSFEGRQLFGLGFFTGTIVNFLRDPVVLFLIFWLNVSY